MATPHVAGLAAILKQEHPTWDGEQLKSAIANSTVPVADATGFDAGTGRVDALDAIHQDVLAPASLSLGSYAWPYSDLAPTTHDAHLHQHRRRAGDAVARPDRRGRRGGADRLDDAGQRHRSPCRRTGRPSVDGRCSTRPSPGPGAYSAVVTATPDDGGGTVRTGVAYLLEPERYDVKVTIKPRAGLAAASPTSSASAASASRGSTSSARSTPRRTRRRATFRLPPGTYATGAISFGLAGDGAQEGVVTYDPSFTVSQEHRDRARRERSTGRFGYTGRPAGRRRRRDPRRRLERRRRLHRASPSTARSTGSTRSRRPDLPAGPRRWPPTGCSASPRACSTSPRGTPVALRPLTAPGGSLTETPVPAIDRQLPDRRRRQRGRSRRTAKAVKGAVAVVSGTCGDLTDAAATPAQGGRGGDGGLRR